MAGMDAVKGGKKRNQIGGGYIALARSLLSDPRYRRPAMRPLTELEALIWLICEAAWKPRALPTRFGAVHNERAELSTTQRLLAKEWNWSKTRVHRYLCELAEDGTISLQMRRPGPKSGPESVAERGYARTLIALCNYDRFQAARYAKNQKSDQNPDQQDVSLLGLIEESYGLSKQTNGTIDKSIEAAGKIIARNKPHHGAENRLMIWWDYGTTEYEQYARDYEEVRGAALLPVLYHGGRGNWFYKLGEAMRGRRRA